MSGAAIRPRRILMLLAGFVVWSGAFVGLYALQALGCYFGWRDITVLGPIDLHRALLIAAFVVAIAIQAGTVWLIWRGRGGPQPIPFLQQTGLWAAMAALVATMLTFAPVLFTSTCV